MTRVFVGDEAPTAAASTTGTGLGSIVRWAIYPACWLIASLMYLLAWREVLAWGTALVLCNALIITTLVTVELMVPYRKSWGATWASFFTDLKYIAINGAFLGAVRFGLALLTINAAGTSVGPASQWPVLIQLLSALLIFEGLQYSVHRYMHRGQGPVGLFFWRLHSAHHLPPKLYVTMHAVGHPLNGLFIQTLVVVIPIWFMGYGPAACTAFFMLSAIHGLIAHFNVDVRMGVMNYLFVGNELHRYHHSSALREAKNFGALLSIYDQLFGTFVYRPNCPPTALGAVDTRTYPDYHNLPATLAFPFRPSKYQNP